MSTKTTFKRIALVAVAALGFGTLSVVPSNAYATLWGISAVTPSITATTNVAAKGLVAINFTGTTAGEINISGATVISTPSGSAITCSSLSYSKNTSTAYTNTNVTLGNQAGAAGDSAVWYTTDECATNNTAGGGNFVNGAQIKATAAGYTKAYFNVGFTPDKVGTYVVRVYAAPLASKDTFYTDLTFTAADPAVLSSTAFVNTDSGTASTVDATAANLTFAATASTTTKARLTVRQYSTADTTTAATTAISKDVVVAISKGLVSKTNDYSGGAASVTTAAAASTNGVSDYYVFANGTIGSASLTITVGGVLVATKALVFNGVATTLSAALTTGQATWIAPNGTTTLTVSAKDSAGNAASNTPTITATSATTSVATVVATSNTLVTITGVAAGTSVITIADSATSSAATSTTYTVTVAPVVSATLPTMSFDKADYAPGELMTVTITAAAADNASFAAFTAAPVVSTNVVVVKQAFTAGAVALVGGKATWTGYAPASGSVTITATSSTGSSATAAVVTATASVTNEALDAASEAIDAANAATDAANAAAEAADAATAAAQDAADAVAALSTSVSAMITALKKQITTLTNLVIKIQKKVKA
jgi:hypothetical protein